MSKELEALDRMSIHRFDDKYEEWDEDYETVENYLESIANAKPIEELEELFKTTYFGSKEEYDKINNCYNSIKQYILKSQEQEKVLEIIKKKKVNIDLLYASSSVEQYNDELVRVYGMWFVKYRQLTQEEFDLLKR